MSSDFSSAAIAALYEVIARRRDIRAFRPDGEVDDATLTRILGAAHQAPSVGYSQPWDFIVVRDRERRARIRESFLRCRAVEAARYPEPRRSQYLAYRLEGILESALNLCVTVDLRPADEATLGTTAQPEALRWSACCAVQNLWLAARAEGVGVGWVSIVEPAVLRQALALPPGIEPVAYLCVGRPVEFRDRPLLEETGWRPRRPLTEAIHHERYPAQAQPAITAAPMAAALIPPVDEAAQVAALAHHDRLCKPPGSLGRLEALGAWYAGARGRFPVAGPARVRLVVMAGDHGVTAEGVSPYSSSVTAAMVGNFLAGGAAANVLCAASAVELEVVDVGVAGDLVSLPTERRAAFVEAKVRAGTGNLRREPAMRREEAEAAIAVGRARAERAAADGVELLCAGEMGIGNTTAAAALLCALTGAAPSDAVGRGTGVDDAGLARKRAVVTDALALHAARDPLGALAALGGLEIAALVGLYLGGAAARLPLVADGFISTVAALVACRLEPAVRDHLCIAHRSAERGHAIACEALGLQPVLDLGLRLGEGTGAVLAAQIVRSAVRVLDEMATFSTAGIADR